MYESSILAESIKKEARARGIQLKVMLSDLNLNKNTLSNMYNGSMIKGDSLARIADYLDCSVDYLLGRTNEPNIVTVNSSSESITKDMDLIKKYHRLPESLQTAVNQILNSYDDLPSHPDANVGATADTNSTAKNKTIAEDAADVVAEGETIFGRENIDVK